MRRSVLAKLGIAGGVAAAAAALSLSGATAASADVSRLYPTFASYTECVYTGNTWAQMGLLYGYSCIPASWDNSKYELHSW
ncbi:hypothetical protein [Actinoallomurus rhizosphaericola]|uniref:hypothetical protein n=1 Tax=Actinoallomurus rhizosphaericola TaxID=2952536 RepID=UPI002093282D|nr:hypothetical protein [Actinoallomurus rhizosphaericola]MCO5999529.1 hypothetical protein [Actinoallomurus rhizosphaericola]